MNYKNKKIEKLERENKFLYIALAIAVLAGVMLSVRLLDEIEYCKHIEYEHANHCTWEWNQYGDYTVCK